MSRKHIPVPVIVLLAIAIIVAAFFGIRALSQKDAAPAAFSGTIESETTNVAAESSGKVVAVSVQEGGNVKAGDVLFRLDDTLLQAQRNAANASLELAQSALENAQAQFNMVDAAVQLDSSPARTLLWTMADPPGYTLPKAYYSQQELLAAAETEVHNAESALQAAQDDLTQKLAQQDATDFKGAEIALMRERAALQTAQDALAKARLTQNQDLIDAAQTQVDDVRENLDTAQANYDDLKDSDAAKAIIAARAQVTLLVETAQLARDAWYKLQTGTEAPKWKTAKAALDQASAAVAQAQAQLALVDAQMSKLVIAAPLDGIVTDVIIKPGEVISAGASAVTIARPGSLTIIVYIPEDQVGSIKLEQKATLTVDSFPEQVFNASVIKIADKAEFTPRNVSTVEGRKTTVFAVTLQIEDPDGQLKAGMPADVVFQP